MRDSQLRRTLHASTADGMCCNAMVGMGETSFCAFLLAVGKSASVAGLVGSVPLLAGAVLQLATPKLLRAVRSHRRWVVGCALAQAAALAAFVAYALAGDISTVGAFALIALYCGASQAGGAGWNGWIERLVPERLRPRFFAQRNRAVQLALVLAIFASGLALDRLGSIGTTLTAFATVFAFAVVARLISTYFLTRHPDVATDASSTKTLTPRAFMQRLVVREDGRIMRYVLGVQFAVHCAGPYFTPFILRKLELSYASFMLLTAALFAGKIMIYPLCARVLARDGAKRLLWIGGVGMVLLPVPWMVSADFTWLLLAQLFAGMAWGTFETATFFLYLKTVPNDERAAMMSMFNVCNAIAMVGGASLGGLFLAALGTSKLAYIALFGVSTLLRMGTLLLLRRIEPTPAHHLVPVAFALVKPAFEIRTLSRQVASFPQRMQRVTVRQRARRRFSEARVASELL